MSDTLAAPPLHTAAQRRWSLAAAIASVTLFGLSIGQGAPLLSLLLEARGVSHTLTGLNAAAAFVGVMIGPLLAPRGVRVLGIRNFLLLCLGLEIILCPLLKVFDSVEAWTVLRALSGMFGSSIFTTSEAWIVLLATGASRGRVVGLYATALSAGFGIGPLLLSATGIEGWPPFIVNGVVIALGTLPLVGVGNLTQELGRRRGVSPLRMVAQARLILLSVTLFSLYEATTFALLPVWGIHLGFDPSLAAATLSAVFVGAVALQWPIGWLSDKIPRLLVLRCCGIVGLLGAIAIAVSAEPTPLLLLALAVWGGIVAAIYPVALSMAGDRFHGHAMVAVNAAIIIAYGLGGLIGPGLGGAAMDAWNPQGLPAFFGVLFASFTLATLVMSEEPRRVAAD